MVEGRAGGSSGVDSFFERGLWDREPCSFLNSTNPLLVWVAGMREDSNVRVCGEPKIFIGQIPLECTQEDVLNLFRTFGTVKSASLMTHMDGRSKGCAMVLYEKWAEAEAAMEACNGNACLGGDRALVVNFADPPKRGGGVPPIAPKTLFVGQVSCTSPCSKMPF